MEPRRSGTSATHEAWDLHHSGTWPLTIGLAQHKLLQFLQDDPGTTRSKRRATIRAGKTLGQATWIHLNCALDYEF